MNEVINPDSRLTIACNFKSEDPDWSFEDYEIIDIYKDGDIICVGYYYYDEDEEDWLGTGDLYTNEDGWFSDLSRLINITSIDAENLEKLKLYAVKVD